MEEAKEKYEKTYFPNCDRGGRWMVGSLFVIYLIYLTPLISIIIRLIIIIKKEAMPVLVAFQTGFDSSFSPYLVQI